MEIKLPELGENIEGGDVINVFIKEGDNIQKNDIIVEIETDKATIEVPSTQTGIAKEIKVKIGDNVKIGQIIAVVETQKTTEKAATKENDLSIDTQSQQKQHQVNKVSSKAANANDIVSKQSIGNVIVESRPDTDEDKQENIALDSSTKISMGLVSTQLVPASPMVRRFSREIGIDITQVKGTGKNQRISIEDVKNYSKQLNSKPNFQGNTRPAITAELPDFSVWGMIERKVSNKIKQATAVQMSRAWQIIPHVTQNDEIDITELEQIRKKNKVAVEKKGIKLSMTSILIKACYFALKKFPQFNASYDIESKEVIYKKYYNIGIAVDTINGLMVPVIRAVEQKNVYELATELSEVSIKARERKIMPSDLQGGNFTISNLGGIGGTTFTPIINWPEVAILGVARGTLKPCYVGKELSARLIMPVSLSYDHRVIDGAEAARFLRYLASILEDPFFVLLEAN